MAEKTSDCAAVVHGWVAALNLTEARALADEKSIVEQTENSRELLDSIQNAEAELGTLMATFNESMARRDWFLNSAFDNKQQADALAAKMATDTQSKTNLELELKNTSKSILGDQTRKQTALDQLKVEHDAVQRLLQQFCAIAGIDFDAAVLGDSAAQNMDESQLICGAALAAMRAQLVALEAAITENEGKTSGLQLKIKNNSDHCDKRGDEIQSLEAQKRRESEELEQLTNRLNGVQITAQNMDREVETSSARKSECIRKLDEQTRHLQELGGKTVRSNESLAARKSKHAFLVEACSHMKDKFAAVGANAAKIFERLATLRARHAELQQLVHQGLVQFEKATASFGENVGEWIEKISKSEKSVLDIQAQQFEVDQQFEEALAMAAKFRDECHVLDAQKQALAAEVAQRRANVAASDETKSKLTADLSSTRASIAALEQSRQAHTVLQRDRDALDAYGQELTTRRNQHAIALQSLQTREDSQRKRALAEQMKEWDAKFHRIRHENETALAELDRAILQQAAPMS
jgi:hypothetical protein